MKIIILHQIYHSELVSEPNIHVGSYICGNNITWRQSL